MLQRGDAAAGRALLTRVVAETSTLGMRHLDRAGGGTALDLTSWVSWSSPVARPADLDPEDGGAVLVDDLSERFVVHVVAIADADDPARGRRSTGAVAAGGRDEHEDGDPRVVLVRRGSVDVHLEVVAGARHPERLDRCRRIEALGDLDRVHLADAHDPLCVVVQPSVAHVLQLTGRMLPSLANVVAASSVEFPARSAAELSNAPAGSFR